MSKLKPCPFCGGEAKVNTLKWMGGYTATALCKNEPNAHYLNIWDEDEAKAVERITEAWNTRAERTCEVDGTIEWRWTGPTTYYEHELSCGHVITSTEKEPPNYCEVCGAKVVEK